MKENIQEQKPENDNLEFKYRHYSRKIRKRLIEWEEAKIKRGSKEGISDQYELGTSFESRFLLTCEQVYKDHLFLKKSIELEKSKGNKSYEAQGLKYNGNTKMNNRFTPKEVMQRWSPASAEEMLRAESVEFFHLNFYTLINNINIMRRKLYSYKQLSNNEAKEIGESEWTVGFSIYYSYLNMKWRVEQDGGGFNAHTREIKFEKKHLANKIFQDATQTADALLLINTYCCIDFNPYGDMISENHWEPRCSDTFIQKVIELFAQQEEQQKVLCFYVLLVARGVFQLFDHEAVMWKKLDCKDLVKIEASPNFFLSASNVEALFPDILVESAIMSERLPVCSDDKCQIKNFVDRQYLLLSNIRQFKEKNLMNHFKPIECETAVLKFLERQGLSNQLNHFIFQNSKISAEGFTPCEDLSQVVSVTKFSYFALRTKTNQILPRSAKYNQKGTQESGFGIYKINAFQKEHYSFNEVNRIWQIIPADLRKLDKFKMIKTNLEMQELINETKTIIQKKEKPTNKFVGPDHARLKQLMHQQKVADQMEVIMDLLPVLNLKLNKQQRALVTSTTHLLCLGRSGTGKTTASVLRMFSQEILYKSLLKREKIGSEAQLNQQIRLHSKDLTKDSGLRYVFVTASPVLSSEVKRFYQNLKEKLTNHLKAQEHNRINKKRLEEIQGNSFDEVVQICEENSQLKPLNSEDIEKKELLEFIELQEKELEDEQTLGNQAGIPAAFEDLEPQHFPLFTTIQRLIYMLDASLPGSFFTRGADKNIIGMNSQLGWHNECGGGSSEGLSVMMINSHYKANIDFDEQISKFGEKIMNLQDIQNNSQGQNNILIYPEDGVQDENRLMQMKDQQNQLEQHNRLEQQLRQTKKPSHLKKADIQLSFEVTFEIFEEKFYSRLAMQRSYKKLSASTVWTEIYSVIKGGVAASDSYFGFIQLHQYLETEGSAFLNGGEKRTVYFAFLSYEKWKANVGAFDFMDVVQHVWKNRWAAKNYWRAYGQRTLEFDYLLCDEVQDLPPKAILLLLGLTRENVFFAGDTAQTIAKGVGARFGDLKDIFTKTKISIPKVIQLSTNYRSHEQILDLANSVVNLIELFFPRSIDRLIKEGAERQGLMPILLMPVDAKQLTRFFMGAKLSAEIASSDQATSLNSQVPQFGCSQVVIVRDQAQKKRLPQTLSNMLCLTVYESKGLEFNDVILYNFFDESEANKAQWNLLNDIVYKTTKVPKLDDEILEFELLDNQNFQEFQKKIKEFEQMTQQDAYVEIDTDEKIEFEERTTIEIKEDGYFSKKRQASNIYKQFSLLCIEFKFLYVAITRAKNRVIIYDDFQSSREAIQSYWQRLGLVHVVSKQMLNDPTQMPQKIKEFYDQGLSDESSTPEQWKVQGIKLFKKKHYDQAVKCFTFSGDEKLVNRCKAQEEAEKAEEQQNRANSLQWKIRNFNYLSKAEKKLYADEAKTLRLQSRKQFIKAGELFAECNLFSFAGSCFYTANDQLRAAEMFSKLKQYAQAGECYFKQGKFHEAAKMFEEGKMMPRAIECYEITQSWEQLLHSLSRCKDQFREEERELLVNKYVPIALNSLYRILSQGGWGDDSSDPINKGKIQEMKIRMKYQKNVNQILEEEDEYGDELENSVLSSKSENKEDYQNQESEHSENNQQINCDSVSKQSERSYDVLDVETVKSENVQEDQEEGEDLLEQIFKIKEKKMKKQDDLKRSQLLNDKNQANASLREDSDDQSDNLVEIVNDSDKSEQTANKKKDYISNFDDFEHLSQFDPDDEFLQSERSFSIIDSILSGNQSLGVRSILSSTSEYSIVASSKDTKSLFSGKTQKSKRCIEVIENKKDNYVEDIVAQKIIYYISLFSEEVKSSLNKLREKGMIQDFKRRESAGAELDEFLIQLDEVDLEFVNNIIDILDYYELFKLSIMLCNRYNLSGRIARYIFSISQKYSNINLFRYDLDKAKISSYKNSVWLERQQGVSILAHEAMHNVFSQIDPKLLTLKQLGEMLTDENSLGMVTYRALLSLGFWKKLVYITQVEMAMALCFKFSNYEQYQVIKENFIDLENLSLGHQNALKKQEFQLQLRDYYLRRNLAQNTENFKAGKEILVEKEQFTFEHVAQNKNNDVKIVHAFYDQLLQGRSLDPKFQLGQIKQNGLKLDELYQSSKSIQMKYLLTMEIASLRKTDWKFLSCMENFGRQTLIEIFDIIAKALKQLTGLHSPEYVVDDNLNEALFATFLISPTTDYKSKEEDLKATMNHQWKEPQNSNQTQELFSDYEDIYVIINVNSPIAPEVIQLQQNILNHSHNEALIKLYSEKRSLFFKESVFKNYLSQEMRKIRGNSSLCVEQFEGTDMWNELVNEGKEKSQTDLSRVRAFFIDLECQFLMVPKNLIHQVVILRLLKVLKRIADKISPYSYEESKEAASYTYCQLDQVQIETYYQKQRSYQEIYNYSKQKVFGNSKQIYQRILEITDKTGSIRSINLQNDLNVYWREVNKNYFKQYSLPNITTQSQTNTLCAFFDKCDQLQSQIHCGPLLKRSRYGFGTSFAIEQGIRLFDRAFDKNVEQDAVYCQKYFDNDPDVCKFNLLFRSFQLLVLADKQNKIYIFDELIRRKVKDLKDTNNIQMLKNFKLVRSIYDSMQTANYEKAAFSYIESLHTLKNYLSLRQQQKFIESALYACLISSSGDQQQIYGPESLIVFLDVLRYDDVQNYCKTYEKMRVQQCHEDEKLFEDDFGVNTEDFEYYDEYDHYNPQKIMKKQSSTYEKGIKLLLIEGEANSELPSSSSNAENFEKFTLLAVILQALCEFMKNSLNVYELVNTMRDTYCNIYNMLITIVANIDFKHFKDQQMKNTVFDLFNKVLDQFAYSPFESHFQSLYLLEEGHLSDRQIEVIYGEFRQTADDQKYTFFDFFSGKLGNRSSGCVCSLVKLVSVPLVKTQNTQTESLKKQVAQLNLAQRLRKCISHPEFKAKQAQRVNFRDLVSIKDYLCHYGLIKITQIQNAKLKKDLLEILQQLTFRKHLLQELIWNKSAKDSTSIQFVASKISDLQEKTDKFINLMKIIIINNSASEYDLKQNEDSKQQQISETKAYLIKFDSEISVWQLQRAGDEYLKTELFALKNKQVIVKWQTYSKQTKKEQLRRLKQNLIRQ